MSPRKNRRATGGKPAAPAGGTARVEQWPDGDWLVRRVAGAAARKEYRCPGCEQLISAGVAHVVAWPADTGGVDDRRHWHAPCWAKRLDRGPNRRRGGAPRY